MTQHENKVLNLYLKDLLELIQLHEVNHTKQYLEQAKYKVHAMKKYIYKNTVPFEPPYTVKK